MSKSLGNVVDPMDMIKKYSADTLRFYLMFVSSPQSDLEWNDSGIESTHKSLIRIHDFIANTKFSEKSNPYFDNKINRTIRDVTPLIDNFEYNKALIKIMDLFSYIQKENCPKIAAETLLLLLSPFTPHLCEELWEKLGNKKLISLEFWPKYEENKINDKIETSENLVETTIKDIRNILNLVKIDPKRVVIYCIPHEKPIYSENSKQLTKAFPNLEIDVYAVNDKTKYDPENKSKKCKPGKPAIYLE
jgi:leucyl-tRNA synthetase